MPRSDLWSAVIVVAISLLALFWILPTWGGQSFGRGMPPQFMPSVGAWAMLVCGLLLVGQSALKLRREPPPPPDLDTPRGGLLFILWPLAYVAVAILAIATVGLIWSGPFIIALLLVLIGERRPLIIAAAALVPPAIIYVLAVHLMRIGII